MGASASKKRLSSRPFCGPSSASLSRDVDVVIGIMGVTGSGKSSFIKTVTGRSDIHTGHSLFSDTSKITAHRFNHKGTNFVLVDTPGFNDSTMSDEEVTTMITQWLDSSYSGGTRLSGIIYIHNINKSRMEGSSNRNLRFFRKLVEGNPFLGVTLATSFWDQVPAAVASSRERELKESKDFWADMVAKGSKVVRIWPDRAICLQVLEEVGARAKDKQLVSSSSNSRDLSHMFKDLSLKPNARQDSSSGKKVVIPGSEIKELQARMAVEKAAEQRVVRKKLQEKKAAHEKELRRAREQQEETLRRQRRQQYEAEERHRYAMEIEQQQRRRELQLVRYEAQRIAEQQRQRLAEEQQRLADQERQRQYQIQQLRLAEEERQRQYLIQQQWQAQQGQWVEYTLYGVHYRMRAQWPYDVYVNGLRIA